MTAAAEREIVYRGVVLLSVSGSGESLRWHATRWNIARLPGGGFAYVDEEFFGPFTTELAAQQQFGPDRFPSKSWWRRQGIVLP